MEPARITPRDLVLALPDLASPPEVYRRLTAILDRGDWDVASLARAVEADPGVAARVLRLVNSPYYGLPRRIASVTEAVGVLGANPLRSLVLATTVLERYRGVPSELLAVGDFWRRSVRVAVVASLLGREAPRAGDREGLLLAGLLHDIGAMVVCLTLPEAAREALLRDPGLAARGGLERAVLGIRWNAVGAALLEHWQLPPSLVEAVGCHPRPDEAPAHPAAAALTGLAVDLGNTFADGQSPAPEPADPRWEMAGLEAPPLAGLEEEAGAGYQATLALFEGDAGHGA